jgi:hypothetical protein
MTSSAKPPPTQAARRVVPSFAVYQYGHKTDHAWQEAGVPVCGGRLARPAEG